MKILRSSKTKKATNIRERVISTLRNLSSFNLKRFKAAQNQDQVSPDKSEENKRELKFGNLKLYAEGQGINDEPIMDIPSKQYFMEFSTALNGIPPPIFILKTAPDYEKMLKFIQSLYGDVVANWQLDID